MFPPGSVHSLDSLKAGDPVSNDLPPFEVVGSGVFEYDDTYYDLDDYDPADDYGYDDLYLDYDETDFWPSSESGC